MIHPTVYDINLSQMSNPSNDVKGLDMENENQDIILFLCQDPDSCTKHTLTRRQLSVAGIFFDRSESKAETMLQGLDEEIPIPMTWATVAGYSSEQAEYGFSKCVEWMKHYNGVAISYPTAAIIKGDNISEKWKDEKSSDGMTPWCVKWIQDIHEESKQCDKIYQVFMCSNYLNIESLTRLCAYYLAYIGKGKTREQMEQIFGIKFPV